MEIPDDFDIEAYCEKTLAMGYVLEAICAAMPEDQRQKALAVLAFFKQQMDTLPDEKDGATEAWHKVRMRLTRYEDCLTGLPPRPALH